jgi:hypothetical protein
VILGARNQIEAHPLQALNQFRVGAHVGPGVVWRGAALVVVEHDLRVAECHIGPAQQVEQAQEAFFAERLEAAGDDQLAGEHHADGAALRFVQSIGHVSGHVHRLCQGMPGLPSCKPYDTRIREKSN